MSNNQTSAKVFNTKKGRVNDSWKNWIRIALAPGGKSEPFAYVEFTDSLIKETILAERKVDTRDIRHKVALIYKRPWTGFRDNLTENTSDYCSYVKKAYWEGRIDQFFIAELIPGQNPKIHDMGLEKEQAMQEASAKIKEREEVAKLAYEAMMSKK